MELSADQLRLAGGAVALAVLGGGGCLAAACCCTGPAEGSKRSKGPRAAGGKARRAGAESGSGKADTAKKKGKGSNDEGGKKTAKKKKKKGSRAPAATSAGDSPSAAAAAAAATEVPHEPGWLTLGLTEHGLGRYAGDFRDLKIDQETCAMYFLGEDSGENWDELFSGDLRAVRPKDRKALKSQIQSIYDYSAVSLAFGRVVDGRGAQLRRTVCTFCRKWTTRSPRQSENRLMQLQRSIWVWP